MMKSGFIEPRQCPCCGHHEVGLRTPQGEFIALRPGMRVQLLEQPAGADGLPRPQESDRPAAVASAALTADPDLVPWVPEPVRGHPALRLKYGVLLPQGLLSRGLDEPTYRAAHLQKLRNLIDREAGAPLPVLLDRFFTAPHLAAGDAKEVALRMWAELPEIRRPVRLVAEWLEHPDRASLMRLRPAAGGPGERVSDADFSTELRALSLEAFLELLGQEP